MFPYRDLFGLLGPYLSGSIFSVLWVTFDPTSCKYADHRKRVIAKDSPHVVLDAYFGCRQGSLSIKNWVLIFKFVIFSAMALAMSIYRTLCVHVFIFFLKISLLEMPISFGNEHLTSTWSPMTTPWPPTDLPEPLIDLPWPSTDLPLTSYDLPLNSHDLPWLFHFLVFFSWKFHS